MHIRSVVQDVIDSEKNNEMLEPFMVQPTLQSPDYLPSSRWLFVVGTATVTTTKTSIYSVLLTATCKSSTGFPICGVTGK